MPKPYTWEEIKGFLIEELKKTKHIMTFGTIGSCNIEHDIDTIITKKPDSSLSEFYREVHAIFDTLNVYMNEKYNGRAIRFATSTEEFLIYALTQRKSADLSFQVMIYSSYPQIKSDWGWFLLEDESIDEIIKSSYDCFYGKKSDLFTTDFQKKHYIDPVVICLYLYDKINSNLPKKVILETMRHSLDLLFRKKLKMKTPQINNEKDVRKCFYQLCDILDKLDKER